MYPENDYDALVMGLVLAVSAPDDASAMKCARVAERLAAGLSPFTRERAKREAGMMLATLDQVAGRTR